MPPEAFDAAAIEDGVTDFIDHAAHDATQALLGDFADLERLLTRLEAEEEN